MLTEIACSNCTEMYVKLDKIATWLEGNAKRLEDFADRCRDYVSLAESERKNAKNYRATAADIRKLLAKVEESNA